MVIVDPEHGIAVIATMASAAITIMNVPVMLMAIAALTIKIDISVNMEETITVLINNGTTNVIRKLLLSTIHAIQTV